MGFCSADVQHVVFYVLRYYAWSLDKFCSFVVVDALSNGAGNSLGQSSVTSVTCGEYFFLSRTHWQACACMVFPFVGASRRYCWSQLREEKKTSYRVEHLLHDWLSDLAVHVTRLRLCLSILTVPEQVSDFCMGR